MRAWFLALVLLWDFNPEPEVTGYLVYFGASPRAYTSVIDVGYANFAVIPHQQDAPSFYAVTAYNAEGLESGFSLEVSWSPNTPARLEVVNGQATVFFLGVPGRHYVVESSVDIRIWLPAVEIFDVPFQWTDPQPATDPRKFYRVRQIFD